MSQLEVDKVIPQSGTTLTIGDSGDTITIASGATLSGDLNASNLSSGTVPIARLGASGTKNSTTFLRGDNTFATVTSVGGATGFDLNDNVKARFGTGNDLEIFHDGSASIISDVGTGRLIIRSDGDGVDINKGTSENIAKFRSDAGVELYYDNSKKFETTSTGATVTGTLTATTGVTATKARSNTLGQSAIQILPSDTVVGYGFRMESSNNDLVFEKSAPSGSEAELLRFKASGGIALGGTGTANTLDDYEEGTFTPAFNSGVNSSGYNYQTGRYTKIGNKVFIEIQLDASGLSGNGDHLKIGGLPFTSNSSAPYGAMSIGYNAGFVSDGNLTILKGSSDSELQFYQRDGSTLLGNETSNINAPLLISGQYTVA